MTKSIKLAMFSLANITIFIVSCSNETVQNRTNSNQPARSVSGVEGIVDRGPLQPASRPGVDNVALLSGAEIVAFDLNGTQIARTRSDANGHYCMPLPSGKYVLVGPKSGIPPRLISKRIEVKNGWITVDLHIDTGIR